jgi:hypothetical protein
LFIRLAKLFSDLANCGRDKRSLPNLISHPQGEQSFSKKRNRLNPEAADRKNPGQIQKRARKQKADGIESDLEAESAYQPVEALLLFQARPSGEDAELVPTISDEEHAATRDALCKPCSSLVGKGREL